ncbi:hypothetical protein [Sutcliffiella cohnii]|uniref:hypothetical protein n=1 Tax=Sutcliffiella cohnii TaxID=33932 RepID=UPI002E1F2EE5|nr:hypothetical protein [Sutcliffiella cohnii]
MLVIPRSATLIPGCRTAATNPTNGINKTYKIACAVTLKTPANRIVFSDRADNCDY